ncbi:MAG: phosphoribosylformylglycinamidine synthase II, partial [Pseudomonadota bacterium]
VGVDISLPDAGDLFGEDQGRYLVACNFDQAEALMTNAARADVPIRSVGRFGGDQVRLCRSGAPLAELSALFHGAFASHFA